MNTNNLAPFIVLQKLVHQIPDTKHLSRPPLRLVPGLAKGESSLTTRRPSGLQTMMRWEPHAPDASDNIVDYYR
jgi:hypothetical protein